jgi:hypothetical protein
MRKYIIIIATESGKKFVYFREYNKRFNWKKMEKWMEEENEKDINEGWWYETVVDVDMVKGLKILPDEIMSVVLKNKKK